jgi:DNA-binding PadR family transcriptional regulator
MGSAATASGQFGDEVILGLLAEEPSCCYQLDRRLAECFGSAGYTDGTARQTVKRLRRADLVRPVDAEADAPPPGASRAGAVYEPTSAGIEHFRR